MISLKLCIFFAQSICLGQTVRRMQTSGARLMAAPDLLISGLNAVVTSDYGHPGAKFKS